MRRLPAELLRLDVDRLALFTRWDVWPILVEQIGDIYPACNCFVWSKLNLGRGNCRHMGSSHEFCYVSARAQHMMRVDGRRPANVVACKTLHTSQLVHPTQKPLAICEHLVQCLAGPDEVILDPFTGAGSIGVAAVRTGRRFIGMELDDEHFETARARLAEACQDDADESRAA